MVCSVYYSGVSQAAVGCVCFNGKEVLTKLTWSHSGIISCARLCRSLENNYEISKCDLSLVFDVCPQLFLLVVEASPSGVDAVFFTGC